MAPRARTHRQHLIGRWLQRLRRVRRLLVNQVRRRGFIRSASRGTDAARHSCHRRRAGLLPERHSRQGQVPDRSRASSCRLRWHLGRGHIVNISSVAGYSGYAGFGVYSSTKFAVEGLSEALHAELTPLGIHVTVVEPGFFRSDILDKDKSLIEAARHLADYDGTSGADTSSTSHRSLVTAATPGSASTRQPSSPSRVYPKRFTRN